MKALLAAVLACSLAAPALAATGWTSVDLVYASDDPAAAAKTLAEIDAALAAAADGVADDD